jgi:hypothetical protein
MDLISATAVPVRFLSFLCFGLVMLSATAFAGVRWSQWNRNANKVVEPRWRGALTLVGFVVSTLSLLAALGLWIHALFTGGFPLYHPILLTFLRVGFWGAVIGLLAGLVGKGQLRLPTIVCSIISFVVWLSEAMAQ